MRRDRRRGAGARRVPRASWRGARCCAVARTSFPSSAWSAATSPARPGRSIASTARSPASRCRPGCVESEPVRPAALQPGDQGRDRARREHHDRRDGAGSLGAAVARRAREAESGSSTDAGATSRATAESSSPTRSSSSAAIAADARSAHRRSAHARQLALLAGRPLRSPGRSQPSFDKQPLRDYLDGERRAGRWNGEHPPPPLPAEVVDATSARYLDAYPPHHGPARSTGDRLHVNFAAKDSSSSPSRR